MQVIGKALVLDEIINYIQSLQRQVEVLILIFYIGLSAETSCRFFVLFLFLLTLILSRQVTGNCSFYQ
jgi:hypothetical protein